METDALLGGRGGEAPGKSGEGLLEAGAGWRCWQQKCLITNSSFELETIQGAPGVNIDKPRHFVTRS